MPTPRRYLDNTIPSDNTAQIGRQQRNNAASTRLTRKVSYSIGMPTAPKVLGKDAPRSINNASARHKELSNYYFRQSPTLGNLAKGVEHWAKSNSIITPDETGMATGYAPSPNKIAIQPVKVRIKYPTYIGDLGKKLNNIKRSLESAGVRVGSSINRALDRARLRYAYLGSRGGSIKNFNSEDPLLFYRDRTGRTIEAMNADRIKEEQLLDTEGFYNSAIRSYIRRASIDELKDIYRAVEQKFGYPHLSGRERAGFFNDGNNSRKATLAYLNNYKDLIKETPIWNKLNDQLTMDHSMHLGYINKVGLPKYTKSRINNHTWAHEDGHLLDLTKLLKKYNAKDFDELVDKTGTDVFWGGTAMNSGAYHWLNDKNLHPSLIEYYYDHMRGTELASRGTQLKNYFGLKKGQRLTPAMIRYAKRHYVRDVGDDNNMQSMLDNIYNYKNAAAWFNNFSHKYGGKINLRSYA